MHKIRRAKEKDREAVMTILKELDIYYSALEFKDFWVAEDDGKVAGCAQLEEFPGFFYLGSLGVTGSKTGKGIATEILNKLLGGLKKDTYIYTTLPDFFKRFGFSVTSPIKGLPSRDRYECDDCHSDRCVLMVRKK